MFLSFEGIDGSGKSTQLRRLAAALSAEGRPVRTVREPGGEPVAERVRALLLDPALDVRPRAELLLFSAARAQLVERVVRPALAAGETVLADRFFDSTTAYQGSGRGLGAPGRSAAFDLDTFHRFVTGGLVPARTYLLDVPAETAAARRAGEDDDRMEAAGLDFFRRVRLAYLALAAQHEGRVLVLDGTRPPDELHAEILADVRGHA